MVINSSKYQLLGNVTNQPLVFILFYFYFCDDCRLVIAYDLIENDYEDGVYVSWDYPDDLSDEDKEAIKNAYDEDGDDGLETLGWHYSDSEDKIVAPYKVSKV